VRVGMQQAVREMRELMADYKPDGSAK